MRKIAINQPTYLPWAGYFNLIASSDCFVFLDNVQFERCSWQNRNRVLQKGRELLLTLPVQRASLDTEIKDIRVSFSKGWQKQHIETIKQSYAKAAHKNDVFELLFPLLEKKHDFLVDYTQTIIIEMLSALKVNTQLHFSSELGAIGNRSDRLLSMCNQLTADCYISPIGARGYLEEDGVFSHADVRLKYQSFTPKQYIQIGNGEFVSHLSMVDVIANIGIDNATHYILDEAVWG